MAKSTSFSVSDVYKAGFETYKKNWQTFLAVSLIIIIISVVSENIKDSLLLEISFWLISTLVWIGVLKLCLDLSNGKKARLDTLLNEFSKVPSYIVSCILYGLAVFLGLLLLVLPGIFIAIRLQLYLYYIVDKSMGPIDALKASWKTTEGHFWDLFLAAVMAIVINILGALALGIGLFVSYPTTLMASAYIYKKIK